MDLRKVASRSATQIFCLRSIKMRSQVVGLDPLDAYLLGEEQLGKLEEGEGRRKKKQSQQQNQGWNRLM